MAANRVGLTARTVLVDRVSVIAAYSKLTRLVKKTGLDQQVRAYEWNPAPLICVAFLRWRESAILRPPLGREWGWNMRSVPGCTIGRWRKKWSLWWARTTLYQLLLFWPWNSLVRTAKLHYNFIIFFCWASVSCMSLYHSEHIISKKIYLLED